MENKFILITKGDEYESKILHVVDKPYVIHDRNLLVINFNYIPPKIEYKGLIEVFHTLLDAKHNHYPSEKNTDLTIADFSLEKADHIYILHHHYSGKERVQLNARLISFFKDRGFYSFFIFPYSKGASDNFALPRESIFGVEEFTTFDVIKENIKAASINKSKIFNFYKEEKLLHDKKITLLDKIKGVNILLLDVLFLTQHINSFSNRKPLPDEFHNLNFPKQVIFTGLFDYFDENSTLDEDIKNRLDPRYRFFDSSIWFRYIPLEKLDNQAIIDITDKNKSLFQLPEAQEFYNFIIRQFNHSYIEPKGSGHAHIAPYGFHSESKMAKWAIEEESMIKDFKWNILIVDDDFSTNEHKGKKQELIDTILKQNRANEGEKSLKTIRQALNKIGVHSIEQDSQNDPKAIENNVPADKKYDIILLDYYFRDNGNGQSEFGEEFLIELLQPEKADTEKKYLNDTYLGPTGKFWIFPISVYSTSLVDKLRDNRITWYDDKWIISPGADPLNTPELFRYKIFSFMRRQLEEFSIQYRPTDDSGTPDPNKHKMLFSQLAFYLIKFMHNLKGKGKFEDNTIIANWVKNPHFEINNEIIKHVQKSMLSIFPNIVEQGVKFKRLCFNKDSSGLAKTVIEKFFFNFEYYDWDHFQNLIYLVAYGNRSNLDQVWNELNYLESRFNNELEGKEGSEVLKHFIDIIKLYLE